MVRVSLPRSRRDPAEDSGLRQLRLGEVLESVVRRAEDHDPSRPARRLFAVTLALLGFGLILQANHAATTLDQADFRRDLTLELGFRAVALVVLMACALIGPARLRGYLHWLVMAALALLACVWVPGLESPYNGAHRWINVGFSVQPSELARIALILWIANRTAQMKGSHRSFGLPVVKTLALVTLFAGMIAGQPDLGGALVLVICASAAMWEGGIDIKRVGAPIAVVAAGLFGVLATVEPYVRNRLGMWLGDVQNDQVQTSIEALSGANAVGTGLGHGVLRNLGFHYQDSDFVFALVAEELGWFGMALVIGLLLAFIGFALQLVASIKDRYCATAAFGLCISVLFQALVHVQVVAGVAPPKGMTLPFLSDGGTSLIVSSAAVGLAIGAGRRESTE